MTTGYNPDFNPTGIEGGVDTNRIPWIEIAAVPGLAIKPLRASSESGMFSVVVHLRKDTHLQHLVYLGAMDLMVLSGAMEYPAGPLAARLEPGIWGYAPANSRIDELVAREDTEFLANFYGPIAFLGDNNKSVDHLITALDVISMAREHNITLVPNTLAECMQPRPDTQGGESQPLAITSADAKELVASITDSAAAPFRHAHFVDTRRLPWIVNPGLPDIALKVLRVSEETGVTSLIVRHNGVADPHYHLGAADFLVLSGHIGYRAGPPEGYGPGVWFFEPAGARHEATQRIGTEDLIYTANVYGPVQFDEGEGTPIVAVLSWMQYKALAETSGGALVRNTYANDSTMLAWAPLGDGA